MSKDMKRLDRIEASLSPKQVMILWMQEAHQYGNVIEYLSYLRSQSDTVYPLRRLPDQVEKSTRTAMKGQPKDLVNAAVRWAVRDVCFLFHLHQRVNTEVITEKRAWDLQLKVLAERLLRIIDEQSSARRERYKADCIADRLSREMPYPLNTDTAAAVDAAIQHEVTTWEMIEEDSIESWLYNHIISQGAIRLPENSYEYDLRDGKCHPRVNENNEKQVRECFRDDVQFERFRSGDDYSHGLAGVTDAEYSKHYDEVVAALHSLVDSGQVKAGATVYLETVPIRFLRAVPLVEGRWIDREVDQGEVTKLRKQVTSSLAKFPGHIKEVDGRLYIHFEDFCNWRGRKLKGDLLPNIESGLVTASWNAWVNAQGGEGIATLAVVSVTLLQCYVEGHPYYACPNGAEDHLCRRKQLIDSLHTSHSRDNQQEELIQDWKGTIEGFLIEVHSFRDVITAVSQHYFDGHQLLFSDLAKELLDIISHTEKLVDIFNDIIDEGMEQYGKMDMESIRQSTSMRTNQQTTYFVDMAKAEALENIGEEQAARKLTGLYLK